MENKENKGPGDSLRGIIKANQDAMHNMSSRIGELNKTKKELLDLFEKITNELSTEITSFNEQLDAHTQAINEKSHGLINALYAKLKKDIASNNSGISSAELESRIELLKEELIYKINEANKPINSNVATLTKEVASLKTNLGKLADSIAPLTENLNQINGSLQTYSVQFHELSTAVQPLPAKLDKGIRFHGIRAGLMVTLLAAVLCMVAFIGYYGLTASSPAQAQTDKVSEPKSEPEEQPEQPEEKPAGKKQKGKK